VITRLYVRALCAAIFLSTAGATALAQSPSGVPSASPPPEIAHVVTSNRADDTLSNVSRTTYVVSKTEMIRRGYRTVGDAIAALPGVELFSYGAVGSAVSAGLRGSSTPQTLVLVDGMPAAGTFGGTVNLGAFSTAGVERIEVVEGGGTTLYGTGAVGGVINIITQSRTSEPFAALRLGSFGDRQARFEGGGFGFERVVSNNAYGLPNNPVFGPQRSFSDYEATTAHAGFDRKIGSHTTAGVRATFGSDHIGVPGSSSFYAPFSREDDTNAETQLSVVHEWTRARGTLQISGSRQTIAFGCTDPACSFVSSALNSEGRVDVSLRNAVEQGNGRIVYGVDLAHGTVRGDDGTGDISSNALSQTAAYLQQTWETGNGNRIYAGLRAERDASLGGQYSPSAGFTQRVASNLVLKGNIARAFRAPNASELYFPFYGNPSLQPERSRVGDLTLNDSAIAGGASLGWFFNFSQDLIVPDLTTFTAINKDQAAISGFTLTVRTLPLNHITAALNLTDLYRAQGFDQSGMMSRLPNDPVINGTLDLTYVAAQRSLVTEAGLRMRVVGNRGDVSFTAPSFDQAVGYSNLDAYVRARLGAHALLTLRGYNLGNERYAEIGGYPMPGRAFAVELSTR